MHLYLDGPAIKDGTGNVLLQASLEGDNGVMLADTAAVETDSTQLATTAFVHTQIDADLLAHTVSTAQIENGAVDTAQLATGAVETAKIEDLNVTGAKIAADTITNAKLSPFQGPSQGLTFEYDFAALGGAAGALTLTLPSAGGALTIPDNAIVTNAWIECITAATSGGAATIALGITGNTDCLIAATAYTDNMFDTPDTVVALTNELPLKTSAAVSVLATIAGADLTAGKFRIHVLYREGA